MINGNLAYKDEYFTRTARSYSSSSGNVRNGYGAHRSASKQNSAVVYSKNSTASRSKKTVHSSKQAAKRPVKAETTVKTIVKDKREMINRKVTLLRIVYMLIIAFSASFMISKYVTVNETANEIRSLSRELENTRAYTSQRVYEMERNIDLSEVEEIATTKLGMQRPESYQIIYVNVDKEDMSELTAKDVEGAGNDIKALFRVLKENIVELFSIN